MSARNVQGSKALGGERRGLLLGGGLVLGALSLGAFGCENTVAGVKKDTTEAKDKVGESVEDTTVAAEKKLEAFKKQGSDKLAEAKSELDKGVSDLGKKIGGSLHAAGDKLEEATK